MAEWICIADWLLEKSDRFPVKKQVSVVIHNFCTCCSFVFVFFLLLVQLMHVGGFALRRGGGFTDDKLSGGGRRRGGGVTLGQMQDN